jgi:superfamily I DNA/RNA helicase
MGETSDEPSIICTSLIGSKGFSAGHVFIVGFNDGHLPRDPDNITDEEVCQFVVGLSRTRKACHVVSVRNYGGNWLTASTFAGWIVPYLEPLKVDKAYLEGS